MRAKPRLPWGPKDEANCREVMRVLQTSPFDATVRGGRLDTDLLIARTIDPLSLPAAALLRLVDARPPGSDAQLGVR